MTHEYLIPPDAAAVSLERWLAAQLQRPHLEVRRWIATGHVQVDDGPAKASRRIQPGQRIRVSPPPLQPHAAQPEALPLPIRYADAHLIVVAKPAGMASHPGPGWWRGSCVNALLHSVRDWPGIGGVAGPGIVHRLDRDTSGLLVFARSESAHRGLLAQLQNQGFAREYLAWCGGTLTGQGLIDAPLGRDPHAPERVCVRTDGKAARTHYRVLAHTPTRSLLALRLETGRTHQIRVHLAHLGHPVWGDPVYGTAAPTGMALHAWRLGFAHPHSGEALHFTEKPPVTWMALGGWEQILRLCGRSFCPW